MKRRLPKFGAVKPEQIAAYILEGAVAPDVVVGPSVLQPDGSLPRYFIVSTCGPEGFRCDQITLIDDGDKALVMLALVQQDRPSSSTTWTMN